MRLHADEDSAGAVAPDRLFAGILPNKFPTTNRPTFQQVLEFDRKGS
jgi:hypothetical protein